MTDKPPTEEELDEAARRLIPKLDRLAARALEEPHDFTTEPNTEHRRKLELRGGRQTDRIGITDSLDVKVTTAFGPKWCALGAHNHASADPVILILELYPGSAGRLELYLCPRHRADLIHKHRRRALAGTIAELHFAGRRILALNPRPLDVDEVLEAAGEEVPPQ